jgi:hypothetical protein
MGTVFSVRSDLKLYLRLSWMSRIHPTLRTGSSAGGQRGAAVSAHAFWVPVSLQHSTHTQLLPSYCHSTNGRRVGELPTYTDCVSEIGKQRETEALWLLWLIEPILATVHCTWQAAVYSRHIKCNQNYLYVFRAMRNVQVRHIPTIATLYTILQATAACFG